jgi:amino acid adenylation domain-containing protein
MNQMRTAIVSGFLESVNIFPDRPALEVDRRTYTYSELLEVAKSFAAVLDIHAVADEPALTAILALRSRTAFAGIVAALIRGHGYVPLNRSYPPSRTELMLRQTACRAVIVDAESSKTIVDIVGRIDRRLVLLFPDLDDVNALRQSLPQHTVLGSKDLARAPSYSPRIPSSDSIAYIIFTSGSTGTPKGVMVSNGNIVSFIKYMADRYEVNERDRFSNTFAITFDGSVLDMFTSWERGACICCPSQKELLNPGAFINTRSLTLWCSVPSVAVFMRRLGSLKKNSYPSLRWSLFGAEALSADIVTSWSEAAPNSGIENVYGPTEVTCVCACYRWDSATSPAQVYRGLVPIGYPNPGMSALVVDDDLNEVAPDENGELLMSGPQVALGYLNDPERTRKAFIVPPGRKSIYYRTGDLVRKQNGNGPLIYLGRLDYQIKVLGHRVELGEIEAMIRDELGVRGVVAIGWPMTANGALGVEVFVEHGGADEAELKKRLSAKLPEFMVPKRFHFLARLPLNENGKYDRKALQELLEDES